MGKIKLPFAPQELIAFYEEYCRRHRITDKEQKRKLWWAMFYHAKDGIPWQDPER